MFRYVQTVELMRLCVSGPGNQEAWAELLRRILPKIKFFVRGSLRAVRHAGTRRYTDVLEESDLVGEVILRLVERDFRVLKRFSGEHESELLGYIAGISRHVVQKSLRKQVPVKQYAESEQGTSGWFPRWSRISSSSWNYCRSLERRILSDQLLQLADKLLHGTGPTAQRDRLIFYLYFVHGLSVSQVAHIGGIRLSRSGVEKVLTRIERQLRSLALGRSGHPEGNPVPCGPRRECGSGFRPEPGAGTAARAGAGL